MRKNRLLLFLFVYTCNFCFAQDIFDFRHTLEFADYLYESGDFRYAAIEYNRAGFLQTLPVSSQVRLFQSYLYSDQFDEGIKKFVSMYPSKLSDCDTLDLIYGKLLINGKHYNEIEWLSNHSQSIDRSQSLYLKVASDLLSGNWEHAILKRKELSESQNLAPITLLLEEIENTRYKSPAIGMCLSAIVPGLGKAYAGYWEEGLFSLLTVSVFAWQSFRGFQRNGTSSVYGWAYATLSASFYIGNLYGSFKSARRKNYMVKQKIFKDAEHIFSNIYCY
ncbi:MAG: hypothetical protein JXR52_12605 [Bacteroidales bacterium]|nr:hypothetical protein [Bacteroidales bacterium]MBN2699659.1 hypothetical protein [Bacteroidales bacterium]